MGGSINFTLQIPRYKFHATDFKLQTLRIQFEGIDLKALILK